MRPRLGADADLARAELALSVYTPAKIVINERTGTIVLGGDVKLTPVSVIHGNLSIEVVTTYTAAPVPSVDAPAFGRGIAKGRRPRARMAEARKYGPGHRRRSPNAAGQPHDQSA